MNLRIFFGALASVAVAVSACAPAGSPGSLGSAPAAAPQAPKNLTIGIATELGSFGDFAGGGGSGGGCGECRAFAHDHLTELRPGDGVVEARLAAEVPSLDAGTWKLNSDGSMDLTWKLRPNIMWHDGTAFTSEDMLFTYNLYKDPSTPKLTTEFIGVGPYRLTRWEPGSFMQYERFDDYYLGPPPLNRVTLQFVKDPNTLVANLLAGEIEAGSHNSIDLATGLEVKQRWEGTANRVDIEPTNI